MPLALELPPDPRNSKPLTAQSGRRPGVSVSQDVCVIRDCSRRVLGGPTSPHRATLFVLLKRLIPATHSSTSPASHLLARLTRTLSRPSIRTPTPAPTRLYLRRTTRTALPPAPAAPAPASSSASPDDLAQLMALGAQICDLLQPGSSSRSRSPVSSYQPTIRASLFSEGDRGSSYYPAISAHLREEVEPTGSRVAALSDALAYSLSATYTPSILYPPSATYTPSISYPPSTTNALLYPPSTTYTPSAMYAPSAIHAPSVSQAPSSTNAVPSSYAPSISTAPSISHAPSSSYAPSISEPSRETSGRLLLGDRRRLLLEAAPEPSAYPWEQSGGSAAGAHATNREYECR